MSPTPPQPITRISTHFFAGHVPFVDVRIGDRDLSFVVDTGADSEIVDAAIGRQLGLHVDKPQIEQQPGGPVEVGKVTGAHLAIGALSTDVPELVAIPLGPLTYVVGRRLDGLVGHTLLRRYIVEFDYEAGTIAFFDPATTHPAGTPIPLEISDIDAYVTVQLVQNGATVDAKLELDTGSFDVAGLSDRFAQSNHLTANKPTLDVPGIAIGGDTSGYRFRIDHLRLGSFDLANVPIGATRGGASDEPTPYAGTLGSEVLRRFTVVLDYPHQRMFLTPRAALSSDFIVDCSGVVLRAQGEHFEELAVNAVIPGSPAERAGLRAGDGLLALDGAPLDGRSLERVIERLYQPGKTLTFRLARGADVTFVTKPLY